MLTGLLLAACSSGSDEPTPPAANNDRDTAAQAEQSSQSQADEQSDPPPDTAEDEDAAGASDNDSGNAEPIEEIATDVTAVVDAALSTEPTVAALTPRISGLVIDDDPDSPVAASIVFGPDDLATRIDFFGPKVESGQSANFALIQFRDVDEAIRVELGPGNVPVSAMIPDFRQLQFSYTGNVMQVQFVGLDGTTNAFSADLTPASTAAFGRDLALRTGDGGARPARMGPDRRPMPDSGITITRGTRLDVLLHAPDPIPAGLAPFVRVTDCTRGSNLSCSFWSIPSGNFWSIGIVHSIFAIGGDVPPPDWPDIESCENARAGIAEWLGGVATSTIAPTAVPAAVAGFEGWLASLGIGTGGTIAGAGLAPSVAAGTIGAVFFSLGMEFGEFLNGEIDCSSVIRRAGLQTGLLSAAQLQEITVEVCFPAVEGLSFDQRCQSVGPYRPFAGDVELGALTFTDEKVVPPLQVTALSVLPGRASEPVGAAATIRGGEGDYTFVWSAPNALNPAGDTTNPIGAASFIFPTGGIHPVSVPVSDKSGQEVTVETTVTIEQLVNIAPQGSAGASTVFAREFNAGLAIDGSISSSWFSSGSTGEGADTSGFVWTAPAPETIAVIRITGNGGHSNPDFRTGFGFAIVTVQILDAGGNLVWQDEAGLPGTPDPTVSFTPDVEGLTVVLIFGDHEASNCGGFAELSVLAWQTPEE
ncbi:MAG: hypothetical protein DK306_002263 [Chloroflexi bacterium]|nr:MAG: hypothetical protein DK306_002263 [Chloroflexota bacterium]